MLRTRRVLVCFALLAGAALRMPAQTTFATITGAVTDPNGAAVPGVAITATHKATNYQYTATSNEAGQYTLANLRDGEYTLRARAAGFQEFVAQAITLLPRDLRRVDARLQLGAVETTIEVTAGLALIETETARVSDSKSLATMRALPQTRRRAWDYFTLSPNVNGNPGSTLRFAGSRANQGEMTIDGVTISTAVGGAGVGPLSDYIEHVQEMRIDMANNSAEIGTIGQMSLVTKGGTNELHGSFFDYYSTPWFRARNPFAFVRTPGVGHKIGGSLNGPVYVPKVYDGRNKTFFLVTLERDAASGTNQLFNPTVPLAPWREGDFSALAPGTAVRDPFAGNTPFAGNRIPASRITSVSKKLQEHFYPLPNFGNTSVLASQNYREQRTRPYESETYKTVRIDHRFSDRAFVFGRFNSDGFKNTPFEGNLPVIGQRISARLARSASVSYSHSIRPALLNEFRWGLVFNNLPVEGPVRGKALVQELGLVGLADNLPDIGGIFKVGFSGLGLTGISQADYRNPGGRTHSHQFQDHLSWFRGRHSLKAGFQLTRANYQDGRQPAALFGDVTFSNRFTGHPYADFLLGIPTTARRAFPDFVDNRLRWTHAYFLTDEYKISPRLTLNVGVRYEYQPGWTERNGRMSMFDIASGKIVVPNGSLSKVSPLMPRGYVDVVEAGAAGFASSTLLKPDRNNIAPRFGVAWRPLGDNTVLRAGYGIFYDTVPRQPNTGGSPFTITEPAFTNPANAPVVIFPRVFPAAGSGGPTTVGLPGGGRIDLRIPYSMQYNMTVEHQRWQTGFRVSYIGTNTRQGVWSYNINQPVADARPFISKPRRFPNYPGIGYATNGAGHQYHSLTGEVERRMARGLHFQASHVWARDIGDLEDGGAPENAYDRRRERGVWTDIPTHRFTGNLVYELPFGKGKSWLSGGGRVLNAIAGGWELSTVYVQQSGGFLTPQWTGPDPTGTGYTTSSTPQQVTIRPDYLRNGNLPADQRSVNQWFDASAFGRPQPGAFGTAGPGVIIGPGLSVVHGGLSKNFFVRERFRVRWEWSATNLLNHPNYDNPAVNISQAAQVGVISGTIRNANVDTAQPRDMRMMLRLEW